MAENAISRKTYDVVIVGARVAGSSLAIRLREKGLRVLLIDKMKEVSDTVSTHFINPRGMTYLQSLGVLPELLKSTPAFNYFDVEVDGIALGGQLDVSELDARFKKVHPEEMFQVQSQYFCVRRPILDGTLLARAREVGVDCLLGTTLKGITQESGSVTAISVDTGEESLTISTEVLVAADGRHSSVANLLQTEMLEERYACTFACYSYYEGLGLRHAMMKKRNRLSFAAVPTSNGKTMILVFGPEKFHTAFSKDREANFEEAIRFIDEPFYKVFKSEGRRSEPFRSTTDQKAFFRKRTDSNVVFVGDAACSKDQCTANGISHALRDAFLLSAELGLAIQKKKTQREAISSFCDRQYLDLFRFYEFTAQQAEMNPLRPGEESLYRAISKSSEERNRFIGLYFDCVPVKDFFKARRIENLTQNEAFPVHTADVLEEKYRNPFEKKAVELALEQSCSDYSLVNGPDLIGRTEPYFDFYQRRQEQGFFQYARTLHRFPGTTTKLNDESGRTIDGVNYASQDYLGLGQDEEIREAAIRAISDFGPHSAGSPMIIGNTLLSKKLEEELKKLTGKKHILLYPTGYAAGMGSILGIVKPEDHIVMDRLSHACLQQGARAATRKIKKFLHLDPAAARAEVKAIREKDSKNGILLVTEGLFSMDADSPDLKAFQAIASEFGATLFVDVAHDLGATGPGGFGQMGQQGVHGKLDLVMGSFSKTFATNGGFLATDSEPLMHYLRMFSTAHLFSNALSPIQAAVALKACQIIQSPKGEKLRKDLLSAVNILRSELSSKGLQTMGNPSPIVPVFIGTEEKARRCHRQLMEKGVAAMIIEYPVVPLGAARYRLQVMAGHTAEQAAIAARAMAEADASFRSLPIEN